MVNFDSFGVEHVPKEIEKHIGHKNIKTNMFRIQANKFNNLWTLTFALDSLILCSQAKLQMVILIYFHLMIKKMTI